jgi:hypothetical protein
VRITGPDDHRARVVVENSRVRGDLTLTHHDAQRLSVGQRAVGQACGQRRVVDEHGAGAHDDGVGDRASAVHVGTGGLAGDPLAGAVGGRTAPVDAGRELPRDVRPAGALLVQPLAQRTTGDLVRQHARAHVDAGRRES